MDVWFKLRVLWWLLCNAAEQWRSDVWSCELDARYCCDGRECGCGGSTNREIWSWRP